MNMNTQVAQKTSIFYFAKTRLLQASIVGALTMLALPSAQASLTPSSINFGTVSAGQQACVSASWSNFSASDNLPEPTRSAQFSATFANFSGAATPNLASNIASSGTVPINICITPNGAGTYLGTLDARVSPSYSNGQTDDLVQMQVSVTPSSNVYVVPTGDAGTLNFGLFVYLGQTAEQSFQLYNYTASPVTITSIATGNTSLVVNNARGFGLGNSIPANGGSGTIYMDFTPPATGNFSGVIQIATTGGNAQEPWQAAGESIAINTSSDSNGTITPSTTVTYNANLTIQATPANGYTLDKLLLDGADVTSFTAFQSGTKTFIYQLSKITSSHTLAASYKVGTPPMSAQVPALPPLAGVIFAVLLAGVVVRANRKQS